MCVPIGPAAEAGSDGMAMTRPLMDRTASTFSGISAGTIRIAAAKSNTPSGRSGDGQDVDAPMARLDEDVGFPL